MTPSSAGGNTLKTVTMEVEKNNPAKHPHVKRDLGHTFIDWLVSDEGQKSIAAYKIGGEQLFFPNAKRG